MTSNFFEINKYLDNNGILDEEKFFNFVNEAFNESDEDGKMIVLECLKKIISIKKERLKELKKEELKNSVLSV